LRNDATFPACKGGSGIIKSKKEFRSLAFAFFPQSKRFLHSVFFGVEASVLNGPACECLLI